MANKWGNNGNSDRFYFLGFQNHCRWWLQPWNKKMLAPWKKIYGQPATAKSLQSCLTLCNPIDDSPPGSHIAGILQARTLDFLLQCMKVKSEREVAQSCPTLCDPMDCSPPGSSIHGIFQARVLEWGSIAFSDDQPRQRVTKQRHYFPDNCLSTQMYGFSSSHVWMWELDHKESWALKNWCFWAVVLEKTLESPLDSKEIKSVNSKGNQSWIFIGRTDAEAPILWPPDNKELIHWKRTWCWERLKAGGVGDFRWWDGWMASPTHWTWVWESSGSWWWKGKPGMLHSMQSQSWTRLSDWTELII